MKIPKPKFKTNKAPKKNRKPETVAGNGTVQQGIAASAGRYGIWAIAILVALIAFTALALGIASVVSNPAKSYAQELKKQTAQEVISDQASAYAQSYLRSYLIATKDNYSDLAKYIGEDSASRNTQKVSTPAEIQDMTVASVEKTNYGYYSVKIQVDVKTKQQKQENGQTVEVDVWQTQWYKVVVSSDGKGTYTPIGFPSSTNAPQTENKRTDYPYAVSSTDVTTAVGDFGKAYLASQGDVNRYISPNAEITALNPALFTDAKLINVTSLNNLDGPVPADGTKEYVLAVYEVTDSQSNTRQQTYPLEITSRGGRWEISTIERSQHTF